MGANELVNDPSYIEMFKVETTEQLEKISEILANFGQQPAETEATVRELFRLFHNIKGSSGMMGLDLLKECMHSAENLLDEVRNGRKKLASAQVDQLLQLTADTGEYLNSSDWTDDHILQPWRTSLTGSTANAPATNSGGNQDSFVLSEAENQAVAAWHKNNKEVYGITVIYPPDTPMVGVSAFLFSKFLEGFGRILKTTPACDRLTIEQFSVFKAVLMVEQAFTPEIEAQICSNTSHGETDIQIRKWVPRTFPKVAEAPSGAKTDCRVNDNTIRVERAKVDKISNEIDELIKITQELTVISQHDCVGSDSRNPLRQVCHRLERLAAFLQSDILNLGMVQVKQVFSRIPLIVRDVAKQTGKQVEVKFHGETTEIDKKVAEKLLDPLTHLLRNAVDHGLEDAAERQKVSKPATGKITVTAGQEGEHILISIQDDGRGLNHEKIRAKAEKSGLIQPGQPLSEAEIAQLIFQPGFSTAAKISSISGRGVGLDVVRESILALNGSVEVDSTPGVGTTFRLKVPLTQAIIQAFLVRTDGQLYGFPLDNFLESAIISGLPPRCDGDIWINNLSVILGAKISRKDGPCPMVITKVGGRKIGLLVDELVGQERIIIKPLNNPLIKDPLFRGIANSCGENVLMLDLDYLKELAQEAKSPGNTCYPEYINHSKVIDIEQARYVRTDIATA